MARAAPQEAVLPQKTMTDHRSHRNPQPRSRRQRCVSIRGGGRERNRLVCTDAGGAWCREGSHAWESRESDSGRKSRSLHIPGSADCASENDLPASGSSGRFSSGRLMLLNDIRGATSESHRWYRIGHLRNGMSGFPDRRKPCRGGRDVGCCMICCRVLFGTRFAPRDRTTGLIGSEQATTTQWRTP